MKFIRTEGTKELESALASRLNDLLGANKRVLWLIPGGSNIEVVCRVMTSLNAEKVSNLTIALTDERYGPPGHDDSNQTQLSKNGFDARGATFLPYLTGLSLEETVRRVEVTVKEAFSGSDYVVGFFGMGADGHTAGMLPKSPAAEENEKWVIGYEASPYIRLTLTTSALKEVSAAYLGAFGKEKLTALLTLQNGHIPVPQQPAQVLKTIEESYVYNDQIGDSPAKLSDNGISESPQHSTDSITNNESLGG